MTNTLRPARLTALVVALTAAVMLLPGPLAGGPYTRRDRLLTALDDGFVRFWHTGDEPAAVVGYWLRFHIIKGALAAILLGVLIAVGISLYRTYVRDTGRRPALAVGGVLVTVLGFLSLLAVMANLQGIVAPFSSLLPMLGDGTPGPAVGGVLTQVRQQVSATDPPAAITVMNDDFGRYHAAMAVIAGTVTLLAAVAAVVLWRAFARSATRRAKRVTASFGVLAVLLALAATTVTIANIGVAANPGPALAAFFNGGW